MNYLPELSVKYKTYLKSAVVDALVEVFADHPDPLLATHTETDTGYGDTLLTRGTKVTLEFPKTKDRYPAIVVRFFERNVSRLGVAHEEWIYLRTADDTPTRMMHNIYDGDLEFGIYGLSNLDRDLMSDTLVQALTMGVVETWTNNLMTALYSNEYDYPTLADASILTVPDHHWNYVQINHDTLQGFGETQEPAPWEAEDEQIYMVNHRVAVLGEFYSVPPDNIAYGFVAEVPTYPYIQDLEDLPEGDPDDPADWE